MSPFNLFRRLKDSRRPRFPQSYVGKLRSLHQEISSPDEAQRFMVDLAKLSPDTPTRMRIALELSSFSETWHGKFSFGLDWPEGQENFHALLSGVISQISQAYLALGKAIFDNDHQQLQMARASYFLNVNEFGRALSALDSALVVPD